jgi:large subunit ribosomal protein L4e
MKAAVVSLKGEPTGDLKLPKQFDTSVRPDLIKKAVVATWKNRVQPYGNKRLAGRTSSAVFSGVRRGYGHSYNWGISRLPRLMVRGGRRVGRVVNVPQAVGGPESHPPGAGKKHSAKINDKERRLAIRSALAATVDRDAVAARGHEVPDSFPLIVDGGFESLSKTKDVTEVLEALGLKDELERASRKKLRAGRGKSRGRKYKRAVGPLIVVSGRCPLVKAASNVPGVDVTDVGHLNAELLAPGSHPGRLTIFTQPAIEKLREDKTFL